LARTRNPQTFREKVRYKMLRDRRPLLVTFADKLAVRDYIADAVGSDHLPLLYGTFDTADALAAFDLPSACVIKPTHGSGAVVVVSPRAPATARLPGPDAAWAYSHVPRERVTMPELAAVARVWLRQLYGQGPNREWAYGPVPRRILVEELLAGPTGEIPDDYKFFVFHGEARFVQVDSGRFGRRTQDFFRPTWERLGLSGGPPGASPPPARPERLAEMVSIAERLGRDTDFVRVDLYAVPGRVVVGELTSYPAGGDSPFDPECFDLEFGRTWTVPKRYR
jgi:hypothetical protein